MEKTVDILKTEAEIAKLMAETTKLQAEASKLIAENAKILRETRWYPLLWATGLLGTALAVAKLFH
ncbi:hypothetical protein [Ralstonia solanacearum]|uniref:hypothetical protein n=1 Tax=Ralstonia solanacearum TaxID=305 RepID=UPI0005AD0F37|nr:hypothetical protein [Ralstonia solanacearum]